MLEAVAHQIRDVGTRTGGSWPVGREAHHPRPLTRITSVSAVCSPSRVCDPAHHSSARHIIHSSDELNTRRPIYNLQD